MIKKDAALSDYVLDSYFRGLSSSKLTKEFYKLSMDFHTDKFTPELCQKEGIDPAAALNFYQRITRIKDNIDDGKPKLSKPQNYTDYSDAQTPEEKSSYRRERPAYREEKAAPKRPYKDKAPIYPEEITARALYHQALDYPKASKFRKLKAMEAFEQFRIACCKADREQRNYKRTELRKAMAIALYLADDIHNAAIYTLGTIHLFNSKDEDLLPLLNDLVVMSKKIMKKNEEFGLSQIRVMSRATEEWIAKLNQNPSYMNVDGLNGSVTDDLIAFFPINNFIFPENRVSNSLIPKEEKATKTSFLGGFLNFFSTPDQSKKVRDPLIGAQMKQIIDDAIPLFYRGQYREFLLSLFNTKSLFELKPWSVPQTMIGQLFDYGYQPDGIAYLIILISNAIFTLETRLQEGLTVDGLRHYAKGLLYKIISTEFLEEQTTGMNLALKIEMQKELALPQCIAMARILMIHSNTKESKMKYEEEMLPYYQMLVNARENLPDAQRWHSTVIDSMRHIAMACGTSLPTPSSIIPENINENESAAESARP